MAIEDDNCIEVVLRTEPILKPIELTNIGFLQQQPTEINCPACDQESLSVVRLEAVTCLQQFLNWANWCKKWQGRTDINHYCSKCGCYIGRYTPVGCSERCISRSARKQAARDDITLKTKPKDCAEYMQCKREQVKAKRAKKRAEKAAKEGKSVVKIEIVNKTST